MATFGCTGFDGGKLRTLAHQCLHVPLDDMGIVESIHLAAFHWVVDNLHARIALGSIHCPGPAVLSVNGICNSKSPTRSV
jgi:hypothetical protein